MRGDPFDGAFLASLAGLRLRLRRRRAADRSGDAAAGGRGGRTEFAGHRLHVPGDDLRAVDWAATARTGRVHVKEHEREAAARVVIALDGSASMGAHGKWDPARRLVAALGVAALQEDARVEVRLLADGGNRRVAALRGRRAAAAILDALRVLRPAGATDLPRSLASLPAPARGGRLAIVSDFLDARGIGGALLPRCARGEEPWLLDVAAPEEERPSARGALILRDPEDPEGTPLGIVVGEREADAFAAEAARRRGEHAALARRLRGAYVHVSTEAPVARVVAALARLVGGTAGRS